MDGKIEFSLGLDSKEFMQSTKAARDAMGNMTAEAVNAGRTMQQSMSGAATVTGGIPKLAGYVGASFAVATKMIDVACRGIGACKDAVTGFALEGLKAAGAVETVATKLKTFTGSAQSARDAAEQVAVFAETPPFGLAETETAARLLMSMGTQVKTLTGELTVIGNVAAAGGMSISELASKMARMSEMGKVSMRDLQGMIQGGIPVVESLAKVMGLPKEAIRKMLGEGEISIENFRAVLNDLGGAGGKFAKSMDDLMGTTPGKLTALQGKWEALQKKIMEPINDGLKPVLDFAINKVGILTDIVGSSSNIIKGLWRDDNLGEFLSVMLIGGIKQTGNYGLAAFKSLFSGATSYFKFQILQVISLFSGKFNDAFVATGKGIWGILKWAFGNAAAYLIDGMSKAGMLLAASITWAVDQVRYWLQYSREKMIIGGNPDKVRPAITLGKSITATDDIRKSLGIDNLVGEIKGNADKGLDDAFTAFRSIPAKLQEVTLKNIRESGKGISFKVEDVFGADADAKKLRGMADKSAPGELKKLEQSIKSLMSLDGKPRKEGPAQKQELAGASTALTPNTKKLADAAKKAAEAAEKLAESLSDAAVLAAQANGEYRIAANLKWQKKFTDATQKYMEGGLSESAARSQARSDLQNEAKYSIDMLNPLKKARMERGEEKSLQDMARGGDKVLSGVFRLRPSFGAAEGLGRHPRDRFAAGGSSAKYLPGLGGLSAASTISPAQSGSQTGQAPKAPQSNGLIGTIQTILTELQTIRTSVQSIGIA